MSFVYRLLVARLQVWELLLIGAFAALLVFRSGEPRDPDPQSATEIEFFRSTYGPSHGTEREEEWLIRDYFRGRHGGYFVDVGANHYKIGNKTYYLEQHQGWSGIAIEPQFEFAADYGTYRRRTKFFQLFVSDKSEETAQLYVLRSSRFVASSDKAFVSQFGKPDEVRAIPTVSLNDLLEREGRQQVDFVSMDIELHEPQALKGFDIQRFKPSLVCIEALLPVRQQILDYFAKNGYVAVGRYLWVDRENLYFTPLGGAPATGQSRN
jgi:FkbM family methyltransferase